MSAVEDLELALTEGIRVVDGYGELGPEAHGLLAEALAEARLEALEQAAQVCNDVAQQETIRTQGHPTSGAYEVGSRNCADAIRALKAAPLDPPGGQHEN